ARLIAIAAAKQAFLHPVEMGDLVVRRKLRMVGDVVGDTDELVERQNRAAMLGRNHPGGHREILIPRALSGPQLCSVETHDPEIKTPKRWLGRRPSTGRPARGHTDRQTPKYLACRPWQSRAAPAPKMAKP